jgi:hypothetical protein
LNLRRPINSGSEASCWDAHSLENGPIIESVRLIPGSTSIENHLYLAHLSGFGFLINKSCLLQTSICCIFQRNNLKSASRMIKNISISTAG